MSNYMDPVTRTALEPLESLTLPSEFLYTSVQDSANKLFYWLNSSSRGNQGYQPLVPCVLHASDSYVTDHLLLTSALAYCLGYERLSDDGDNTALHLLRLAAMSHELSNRTKLLTSLVEHRLFLETAWDLLDNQAKQLEDGYHKDTFISLAGKNPPTDDLRLATLWYAHLAASDRLFNKIWTLPNEDEEVKSLATLNDFNMHPLAGGGQISLVYGGATKIKNYVFESARLPEIRGASSLFDRINILDMPALWGRQPQKEDYPSANGYAGATRRYEQVRRQFFAVDATECCLLDAPECILYASGGNILALAPPMVANKLADTIEQLYTEETLVGNSVAVAQPYSLLELQYGRVPEKFWIDDFTTIMTTGDAMSQSLLLSHFGSSNRTTHSHDQKFDEYHFVIRKGFGELVTILTSEANRRRAGNESTDRITRHLAQYELLPIMAKCHSCDLRPAVVPIDDSEVEVAIGSPKIFCEACARKRIAGQAAKRNVLSDEVSPDKLHSDKDPVGNWFTRQFEWSPEGIPSWEELFEGFLREHPRYESSYYEIAYQRGLKHFQVKAAEDVGEIANVSKPTGYMGYIYADGNDVGNLVARIRTPGAYRQFGQRLYQANVYAVFTALAKHLQAYYQKTASQPDRQKWRTDIYIHPFEIITIGGDDLILIVPGDKAVDIARTIADELEQRVLGPQPNHAKEQSTQDRYNPPEGASIDTQRWSAETWPAITLSAGIAIAQSHTPILYISKLAQQLQESAKKARKSGALVNYPGGTVDFAALKTSGAVSLPWSDYHKRAFEMQSTTRLSMRPYTWSELGGLAETIRAMKQQRYPRSQLYRLQEDLYLGRSAATLNYLYFLVRSRNSAIKELLGTYQLGWLAAYDLPPWRTVTDNKTEENHNGRQRSKIVETIWRDLVELYDFIPNVDLQSDSESIKGENGSEMQQNLTVDIETAGGS